MEFISSIVNAACCQTKEVAGDDGKAGTYILVRESANIPDFCIGGCAYTKENDEKPGSYYCFKSGNSNTTCSEPGNGGSCSMVEGWIEKYFERECKMQVNTVLEIGVQKDLIHECKSNRCNIPIEGSMVKLFKGNRDCSGEPIMERRSMAPISNCGPSNAQLFVAITEQDTWSVAVEAEGFLPRCVMVLAPKVFDTNTIIVELDHTSLEKYPTIFLSFEHTADSRLLPDLKVISTWMENCRNGTVKPGSEQWCNPTCGAVSWVTEEPDFNCDCRGTLGRGMSFTEVEYPNDDNVYGKAKLEGTIFWHNEEEEPKDLGDGKAFLIYGVFNRRDDSINVCASKLNFGMKYPENTTDAVNMSVPCVPPQIPTTDTTPTPSNGQRVKRQEGHDEHEGDGHGGEGTETATTMTMEEINAMKEKHMDMFTEVEGNLIYGGGDRFWLAGCMKYANLKNFMYLPNFFSNLDPKYTPAFCGCLFALEPSPSEFTVDQVKACYVEAVIGGISSHMHGLEEEDHD